MYATSIVNADGTSYYLDGISANTTGPTKTTGEYDFTVGGSQTFGTLYVLVTPYAENTESPWNSAAIDNVFSVQIAPRQSGEGYTFTVYSQDVLSAAEDPYGGTDPMPQNAAFTFVVFGIEDPPPP